MIIDAFGEKIFYQRDIDFSQYGTSSAFGQTLDLYLNAFPGYVDPNQCGQAQSTVNASLGLLQLPDFNNFFSLLIPHFNTALVELGIGADEPLTMRRAWSNRMYRGCKGAAHDHLGDIKLVGIFYYDAPAPAGNLVFTKREHERKFDDQIASEDKVYFEPTTGTLVCHRSTMLHAISEHGSDDPRVCLVFEF